MMKYSTQKFSSTLLHCHCWAQVNRESSVHDLIPICLTSRPLRLRQARLQQAVPQLEREIVLKPFFSFHMLLLDGVYNGGHGQPRNRPLQKIQESAGYNRSNGLCRESGCDSRYCRMAWLT
jgi:hypothetical protein